MQAEIPKAKELEKKVFAIDNEEHFHSIALEVFLFQFANNPVYRQYCSAIHKEPDRVKELKDIPFLPISFFKSHAIKTGVFDPELIFKSSGTTGNDTSTHFVKSAGLYEQSFMKTFHLFFGDVKEYCIVGLLPSYLEKGDSSLVYMVNHLIKESRHAGSGFYLYDHNKLDWKLKELEAQKQKTILFGVTYALTGFIEKYPQNLATTIIIETGGMKGRGKEMTKQELYVRLNEGFGGSPVYSEYGMTELLSQAYAKEGVFTCPPWMKISIRDETDPFTVYSPTDRQTGVINVMDLANLYSCSFIATDDVARMRTDGSFEILGRRDHSDIRGCSLLVM